jgi:hypothetical protein
MPDYGILGTPENVDRMVRTLTQDRWEVIYGNTLFGDATTWDNAKLGVRLLFEDRGDVSECEIHLNGSLHSTAKRVKTGILYESPGGGYRTPS